MTAKQKVARAKFKQVVAEASKLRKKNPKLTQAQAVKQAWAIEYSKAKKGKKVAAIKIIEKGEKKNAKPKATYQQVRSKKGTYKGLKKVGAVKSSVKAKKRNSTEMHTDTKSHNVNIRVMNGMNKLSNESINKYKDVLKDIKNYQDAVDRLKKDYLGLTTPEKVRAKFVIKRFNSIIKELKTHARELKKHI